MAPPAKQRGAPGDGGDIVSAWLTNLRFDWSAVTRGARSRRFGKDETLFLEGQTADTVYVVQEGRVRLTSFGFDGKERHLMIVGADGLAGRSCVFARTRTILAAGRLTLKLIAWLLPRH